MRRLLIVSPHFAPVNAPDGQRARMSLPYYREFGWEPHVLAVGAEDQPEPRDETLMETLPADARVTRTAALPSALTRRLGIGNVALRAWPQLFRTGTKLIRQERIDLVFFSTTMFFAMPMGRMWRSRHGTPYVLDFQDPWFTTYYDDKPAAVHPPKHRLSNGVHRRLERWTMKRVAGVMSVSDAYTEALRARYAWLDPSTCETIPFGAAERDMELAAKLVEPSSMSVPAAVPVGIYVGRAGTVMATALRILFRGTLMPGGPAAGVPAFRFIGTDYAPEGQARKTVEPVAREEGVGGCVEEVTGRLPYLEAQAQLLRADFLVIIGSDDPAYSASKVYPYILAKKPLLAVVHESSPIVEVLRRTRAGTIVTFAGASDIEAPAARLRQVWPEFLRKMGHGPDTDWTAFEPYLARNLTARQCALFDRVMERRERP